MIVGCKRVSIQRVRNNYSKVRKKDERDYRVKDVRSYENREYVYNRWTMKISISNMLIGIINCRHLLLTGVRYCKRIVDLRSLGINALIKIRISIIWDKARFIHVDETCKCNQRS